MAKVFSREQNKFIEVPDEEFSQISVAAGPAPTGVPQADQAGVPSAGGNQLDQGITTQPQQQTVNPFGVSVNELRTAQARAIAAGDTKAAAQFGQFIELEESAAESGRLEQEAEGQPEPSDIRTIDQLESLFFGEGEGDESLAFGKTGFLGRLPGVQKGIERSISPGEPGSATERLNTYIRTLESIRPQLAKMAGDTGNIAFAEQLQAGKGLPQATDTPTEAIAIMQSAREKFGLEPSARLEQLKQDIGTEQGEDQEADGSKSIAGRLIDVGSAGLDFARDQFSGTENVIRDVVQTPLAAARTEASEDLITSAESLMDQAEEIEDPEVAQDLRDQALEMFEQVSAEMEDVQGEFSEDIDQSVARRAITAGAEVGGGADILTGAAGLRQLGRGALSKGRGALSKIPLGRKAGKEVLQEGLEKASTGKAIRNSAIQTAQSTGKKIDGNKVFRGIQQWAKEAKAGVSSSKARQIDDFVSRAQRFYKGKKLNPTTAKTRWDTAGEGFSNAGKAGKTVEAGFHRAVRDSVRKELDEVTGGAFEKGTKMISEALDQEKILGSVRDSLQREAVKQSLKSPTKEFLKQTGGRAVGTAAGGLGLLAAGKALGLNFPGAAFRGE